MNFLKAEVENEQRICLAAEGFGLRTAESTETNGKRKQSKVGSAIPTATGLVNCDSQCVFCNAGHESNSCHKARKLTLADKKKVLKEKNACYRCLKVGHQFRKCHSSIRCIICNKWHAAMVCPELPANKRDINTEPTEIEPRTQDQVLANHTGSHVFLQTLSILLKCTTGFCKVRALIDTGSHRSYILKSTAVKLGYKPKRTENLLHCLFGGVQKMTNHNCYDITVVGNDYSCHFEAMDQAAICNELPPVFDGPWTAELRSRGIIVTDAGSTGPIEILIGADAAGKLYTGTVHVLSCGLLAVETKLDWTIMGKADLRGGTVAMNTISLLVNDTSIARLWELEVLGIAEPAAKQSREEMEAAAKQLFMETAKVNDEGRYEVCLPWLEGHPPLKTNYKLAQNRLDSTLRKLKKDELVDSYGAVFQEWLAEGVIERIEESSLEVQGHYLPHRPVIKESSLTTKIRPVFDASAHEKDGISLNQCLEKGPNLIELIPSILLRFRENPVGVVADIRKAFLQISLSESDRNFLKFLWIDSEEKVVTYRHKRVVFGVNCSPFLLGATIEHHLSECRKRCENGKMGYSLDTVDKLANSFYVDNCVTSVADRHTLQRFRKEAEIIMQEAKFDLRGWESSEDTNQNSAVVPVLGLLWHLGTDTLSISEECLKNNPKLDNSLMTKRIILSMAQRVFDVIGFTCPATLVPKLLLQKAWEKNLRWDEPAGEEIAKPFREWLELLPCLLKIEVPRWINTGASDGQHIELHTFCDASKNAFAAVVFLRVSQNDHVKVHILAAKTRVAPVRMLTIPRLELLAAVIGARLYSGIKRTLACEIDTFFWSDSSTIISWIQRKEEWNTFVGNRVSEIRKLTDPDKWQHIPGDQNPADLPSRGCSPSQLLESKWWEGPKWLYEEPYMWPRGKLDCNEDEIAQERKKGVTAILMDSNTDFWHLSHFSSYLKTVRMIAWVFRFVYNSDVKGWLSFWAQFRKIHEDEDIDDNDKIEYLIQATTSGSRARRLVESFPAMAENYGKIVDSMHARFGREDLLIEVYVRELLKLILSNAAAPNKVEISVLYDKIETQLRALDTLGVTSEKCSAMLYPLIESCLPQDLLRVWQRSTPASEALKRTSSQTSVASAVDEVKLESRLQGLMNFLKAEVENEQRICLAAEGFGLRTAESTETNGKRKQSKVGSAIPTATGFVFLTMHTVVRNSGYLVWTSLYANYWGF
ncbi:hypothetical protein NQ315_015217 [Exocentrus adspersus]|uniref:CCHC-type domain-containing protein n=1 Tax=Exocentrus adspersus TaxID=1586481 RepID=A0AAV8VVW6_9CUCU|nr:hypothetical protein NQ315_015217 [Exocentrus adspersus]